MRIIRDTREKKGWFFTPQEPFLGFIDYKLKTGDYSVEGLEDIVSIERKASIDELANNLKGKRFFRELERLDKIKYAFLLLEFNLSDLIHYPKTSRLSPAQKKKLRINAGFLWKKMMEIYTDYPNIKVIFCGSKYVAYTIALKILTKAAVENARPDK